MLEEKSAQSKAGLDLSAMYGKGSLSEYMKKIVHGQNPQSKDEFATKISSSKNSSRSLAFDGDNLYWAMGGTKAENIPFVNPSTTTAEGRNGIEAQLERLRAHFSESFANVKVQYDQNSDFNLPLLNNDGTLSTQSGTYKDFIKENHTSTVMAKEDRNGDHIYTVQHFMTLDMDEALDADEVTEEAVDEKTKKGPEVNQVIKKKKVLKKPVMKIGKKRVSLKPAQKVGSAMDAEVKSAMAAFYDEFKDMETTNGIPFTTVYPSSAALYAKYMSIPIPQAVDDFLEQEKCGLV